MLDTKTTRDILLVEKMPVSTVQVDQITTVLIYKFMDDMEQKVKRAWR